MSEISEMREIIKEAADDQMKLAEQLGQFLEDNTTLMNRANDTLSESNSHIDDEVGNALEEAKNAISDAKNALTDAAQKAEDYADSL